MIINVVRGFSLVMHDPEGSHYKIRRQKASKMPKIVPVIARLKKSAEAIPVGGNEIATSPR